MCVIMKDGEVLVQYLSCNVHLFTYMKTHSEKFSAFVRHLQDAKDAEDDDDFSRKLNAIMTQFIKDLRAKALFLKKEMRNFFLDVYRFPYFLTLSIFNIGDIDGHHLDAALSFEEYHAFQALPHRREGNRGRAPNAVVTTFPTEVMKEFDSIYDKAYDYALESASIPHEQEQEPSWFKIYCNSVVLKIDVVMKCLARAGTVIAYTSLRM
ncbi:hypothetical protein EW146_g2096 [Bondarzewia mesenterica]|uniref:Uncharacterized protein n=1 Tax=Bondarzewia mesenterica TaxID=1095465 RepID=A0A4V3XFV0_9AGAM|nr:hypothetical protein EW146_g2096 [Bondarzewia mesenterica]